ncbi:unnamed protein product [Heterobilharzia americana]|nr:unnamed protein product [Heterobilharzia americana]
MYRFSQLTASPELRKQFCDLKLESKSQTASEKECLHLTTKSMKRKSPTTSKDLKEPVKTHHSDFTLKSCDDTTNHCLYLEPCGFRNVRNSCFLNACLQLLLNMPPFCAALHKSHDNNCVSKIQSADVTSETQEKKTPLTNQLFKLMEQLNPHTEHSDIRNNDHHCYKPVQTKVGNTNGPNSSVWKESDVNGVQPYVLNHSLTPNPMFAQLLRMDSGFQEDAAECLTYLLTQLHEEMSSSILESEIVNLNEGDRNQSDSDWFVAGRAGKHYPEARKIELDGRSPISSLFCGTIVTRSSVGKTNSQSSMNVESKKISVKEPFFILPVPIDDPSVNSVESALRCLAESEQITDYHDPSGTHIHRRSTLDHLPPYLILQLKRFYNESKVNTVQSCVHNIKGSVNKNTNRKVSADIRKHLKSVNIQSKLVIPKVLLSQETHFSSAQRQYRLWAVIFHVGETVASGHYTIAVHVDDPCQKLDNSSSAFLYLMMIEPVD